MPFNGRGGSSPPSDTEHWGISPPGWEYSHRLRRVAAGRSPNPPATGPIAAAVVPATSPNDWTVLRAVIASIDVNRRVSVGRLGLTTREFVVATWSPFVQQPKDWSSHDHHRG